MADAFVHSRYDHNPSSTSHRSLFAKRSRKMYEGSSSSSSSSSDESSSFAMHANQGRAI